jgi:hypothetical protein
VPSLGDARNERISSPVTRCDRPIPGTRSRDRDTGWSAGVVYNAAVAGCHWLSLNFAGSPIALGAFRLRAVAASTCRLAACAGKCRPCQRRAFAIRYSQLRTHDAGRKVFESAGTRLAASRSPLRATRLGTDNRRCPAPVRLSTHPGLASVLHFLTAMPFYYFKLEDVTVAQIEAIKLARRCATLAPTLWTALFHLRGLSKAGPEFASSPSRSHSPAEAHGSRSGGQVSSAHLC